MSFQRIVDEFPVDDRGNRRQYRHHFRQAEMLRDLAPNDAGVAGGVCYNLCYWFAVLRLTQNPNSFAEFAQPDMLQVAIDNQRRERFEISERYLRIGPHGVQVIQREFASRYCLFRVNTTLRNSLEIIDAILAARAVSMLVLRQSKQGPGHAVAFDTRTNITFFDPNFGWFVDRSAPVGAAYFRDWFHRFYHASFYKNLFENGGRQLVVWLPPPPPKGSAA